MERALRRMGQDRRTTTGSQLLADLAFVPAFRYGKKVAVGIFNNTIRIRDDRSITNLALPSRPSQIFGRSRLLRVLIFSRRAFRFYSRQTNAGIALTF